MGILFCKDEISSEEDLERKALEDIYYALNGFWWTGDNKENWLSSKPVGEWSHVTTDNSGRVVRLTLINNENGSSATIPDSIGNLKHLQELDLGGNNITTIPWEKLKELTHLHTLWLEGNNNLKGNQDDVNGLGFIKSLNLPKHIPKPPPIHYPAKELIGFKHKLLTSGLAITSFADIISDIFTAISMIHISFPMFVGQVALIAFPGVYMSINVLNPIKKFWFAIGLGSLYEYLKAIYTHIEDGELMEFKVIETLIESCPSGVLQLYFLSQFEVSNQEFETVLISLILGIVASGFTIATAVFPLESFYVENHSTALQVIHQSSEIIHRMVLATMMFLAAGPYAFLYIIAAFGTRWVLFVNPRIFEDLIGCFCFQDGCGASCVWTYAQLVTSARACTQMQLDLTS